MARGSHLGGNGMECKHKHRSVIRVTQRVISRRSFAVRKLYNFATRDRHRAAARARLLLLQSESSSIASIAVGRR